MTNGSSSIWGADKVQRQNRMMAAGLAAATVGVLWYYAKTRENDQNSDIGRKMNEAKRSAGDTMEDVGKNLKK